MLGLVCIVCFSGSSAALAMRRMLNCFAPNINIVRDPRWGRGHETYGEVSAEKA